MNNEISAPSLAAVATIVAALIASAISYVNLTLTKEQKTSEFRQAWIDALREDLATFFATIRAFARATQELKHFGKGSKEGAPLAMTEEKISDLRYQVAETRYRIQLRLNLDEADHIELFRLMNFALGKQQDLIDGKSDVDQTLKAVEEAADFAPGVLKKEWIRVKRGERAFRLTRNWFAPAIILASIVFMVWFWAVMLKA